MDNLSVIQAARRLGVSASWLNKMRITGGGPPYLKLGRRVVYETADLDRWVATRRRRNTSVEPNCLRNTGEC
jgi:predicted DNA-binding transcriptional regulator AlpA